MNLGEPRKAIEFLEQAVRILQEIGDRSLEGTHSWNLGDELVKQGERERGLALMQVLVDYERELGHPDAEEHAAQVEELRREGQK